MCLAETHTTVPPVRLEPATPRSQFKYSTTELLCSLIQDVENGKYDHIKKSFEEEFERMKYTTQEVLDQIFGGGGAQFGANENMMLQVGDSRERHDSGRGDSSVEGSLSSVSEGGTITDSINRLHIQKSLSIEDDVFQIGKYVR